MIGAVALALFAAGPANTPARPTAGQCEIALQAVKSIATKEKNKVVFNFVDDDFSFQRLTPAMLSGGWSRWDGRLIEVAPPPSELIDKFLRSGMRNAVSRCQAVRTWLNSKKIKFGRRAAAAVFDRLDENERLPVGVYTIGLPVISENGGTALRYIASTFGSDASGGNAEYLVRDMHGEWTLIATFELFIS